MATVRHSRVVLLYGGSWEEREVSIASATRVAPALARSGLEVVPVRWDTGGWTLLDEGEFDLEAPGESRSPIDVMADLRREGFGVVFNILHGGPGEDGTVQGFLEVAGAAYTGAGVTGSVVAGNKELFRERASQLGAEVAPGIVIPRPRWLFDANEILTAISVEVGLPAVVKPLTSGSSCGVFRVDDPAALEVALEESLAREEKVLVERYVSGREISVPCLGTRADEPPLVLPAVEIEPLTGTRIFDYEAKYQPGKAREIVPAPLDPEMERHLVELVGGLHWTLDLGGMSRTDIILGADGPVLLETNTIPGLTEESLVPKSAAAVGIDFPSLCRRLIDYAVAVRLTRGIQAQPLGRARGT